jgi:hypothetical protein
VEVMNLKLVAPRRELFGKEYFCNLFQVKISLDKDSLKPLTNSSSIEFDNWGTILANRFSL